MEVSNTSHQLSQLCFLLLPDALTFDDTAGISRCSSSIAAAASLSNNSGAGSMYSPSVSLVPRAFLTVSETCTVDEVLLRDVGWSTFQTMHEIDELESRGVSVTSA